MTDTTYPFVGGPLDGRRLATNGARIIIAPMRPLQIDYSTSAYYSQFDHRPQRR
jgi:hypothetical protein